MVTGKQAVMGVLGTYKPRKTKESRKGAKHGRRRNFGLEIALAEKKMAQFPEDTIFWKRANEKRNALIAEMNKAKDI